MTKIKQITMQDYASLLYVGEVLNTTEEGRYKLVEAKAEGAVYHFILNLDTEVVYLIEDDELRSQILKKTNELENIFKEMSKYVDVPSQKE